MCLNKIKPAAEQAFSNSKVVAFCEKCSCIDFVNKCLGNSSSAPLVWLGS